MRRNSLSVALLLSWAAIVEAQQVTVQQPVVEQFGVSTTVSVPDRGSALLGGVGSARSGRITTGPFRSGSSLGREIQGSSASVHVHIHDFEAMDAALLNEPVKSRIEPRILGRLNRNAAVRDAVVTSPPRTDVAREAEQLARQAESRGKTGVAKLHWQRAARHGSSIAAQRLAENYASAKRR